MFVLQYELQFVDLSFTLAELCSHTLVALFSGTSGTRFPNFTPKLFGDTLASFPFTQYVLAVIICLGNA